MLLIGGAVAAWCGVAFAAAADPPAPATASPQALEFFETRVRPVLAAHCYACHGEKVQQAGLRLDTRAGLLKGTDTGKKVVAPGDPDASLLIQAVRYAGAVKMPPAGRLPDAVVQVLTDWVRTGAAFPEPRGEAGKTREQKPHWAFQPVRRPQLPVVRNPAWVRNPIDAFVLARLEAKGLKPAPEADRRTLIRRLTYDLTGLPATAEEIEAFVRDTTRDAYTKVVDRVLASPTYGERWGRQWLDVARFADTKGYVFTEDRNYTYAYTYRDWVIRSLNEDLPYDQFIIQQLAADQLPSEGDRRSLAAMGFLTLGRRFLNSQPDIIDDRMDVTIRGFQALTVGCARCHDHKFDPIPIKDYYSLYGVFASSTEPRDLPLLGEAEQTAAYRTFQEQLKTLRAEHDRYLDARHSEAVKRARESIAVSLMAAREVDRGAELRDVAQRRELPFGLVARWRTFLMETRRTHHPVMAAWHKLAALSDAEFAAKGPELVARLAANADPDARLHPAIAAMLGGPAPTTLAEVAERYAKVLSGSSPDQQIRNALTSIGGPLNIPRDQAEQLLNRAERDRLRNLKMKADAFEASSPAAPPRAMVLNDSREPFRARVFLRGNPNNPGDEVPRQFLSVVAGPSRTPFEKGSGRLELAQAIASRENPLTSRVMVNRVWLGHFGRGLVTTPSDFGVRSDPPSHPELLDWLAEAFSASSPPRPPGTAGVPPAGGGTSPVARAASNAGPHALNWSLKALHRLIVTSATYRQSSQASPQAVALDPDNRLLSRMNRRRLDFEGMRDALLAASGELDRTIGGRCVDVVKADNNRRSVYASIDRQNLPGLFRVFDFASPDTHSPQRYETTVPQQALFLMNSPFIIRQARALVARPEIARQTSERAKIEQLYRHAYARPPSVEEINLGMRFLRAATGQPAGVTPPESSVWQYGMGTLDETAGQLTSFAPFVWNGDAWQVGKEYPDPKLGAARLTRTGGAAGSDPQRPVVRRWVAPRDATVSIMGFLMHTGDQGDGVRGRIVSSRTGVVGSWTADNQRVEAAVPSLALRKGDTLDFLVDCRADAENDTFQWTPLIRALEGGASASEWSAAGGFEGPPPPMPQPLTPWEKYAQALLISNEFFFTD